MWSGQNKDIGWENIWLEGRCIGLNDDSQGLERGKGGEENGNGFSIPGDEVTGGVACACDIIIYMGVRDSGMGTYNERREGGRGGKGCKETS